MFAIHSANIDQAPSGNRDSALWELRSFQRSLIRQRVLVALSSKEILHLVASHPTHPGPRHNDPAPRLLPGPPHWSPCSCPHLLTLSSPQSSLSDAFTHGSQAVSFPHPEPSQRRRQNPCHDLHHPARPCLLVPSLASSPPLPFADSQLHLFCLFAVP